MEPGGMMLEEVSIGKQAPRDAPGDVKMLEFIGVELALA